MRDIPTLIESTLRTDNIQIDRIHRIGPSVQNPNSKPRTIVAVISNYKMKEHILQRYKEAKHNSKELSFHITSQSPTDIVEKRKHLYDLQKQYKDHSVHTKIINDRLVFTFNGTIYKEKVKIPKAEEILLCDNTELKSLDDVVTETIEPITEAGNKFVGTASKDQAGKLHEGHDDDGEIGAGRQITDFMKSNAIKIWPLIICHGIFGLKRELIIDGLLTIGNIMKTFKMKLFRGFFYTVNSNFAEVSMRQDKCFDSKFKFRYRQLQQLLYFTNKTHIYYI
ncbi:hypothetical protein KUTeg_010582 [Tegillarca granosa]|uniref:Uncharacterized protein n=1 Tax=Tegillarca granosa TaxID=220873 RepID=A0ABQ9F391_TEGGR|nr:hypothetical protein KUTeg_010582 [Tegillarca granosa]